MHRGHCVERALCIGGAVYKGAVSRGYCTQGMLHIGHRTLEVLHTRGVVHKWHGALWALHIWRCAQGVVH